MELVDINTETNSANAMRQARETVDKILQMTSNLRLTGVRELEEQEIEAYVNLIEEREPLVAKLAQLKKEIDASLMETSEFQEIKRVLSDISTLDKEHIAFMEILHTDVKGAIKDVKNAQKVNAAYGQPMGDVPGRFDVKK